MIVVGRLWRDRRRSLMWWSLSIIGLILLTTAFYPSLKNEPSFDEAFKDLPESVQALVGAQGLSLTTPAGYLHGQLFTQLLPIALLIFAIALGARAIATAEDDGTLELMLANPIPRSRLSAQRYIGAVALILALGAVMTVATIALSAPFGLLEGISFANLAGACIALICFAVLHASIAFAVGGAVGGRGRSMAVAGAIAAVGFIVYGLVSGGLIPWARFVDPWWWYLSRNLVANGLGAEAILAPLGLSAVLAFVGVRAFERRDLK